MIALDENGNFVVDANNHLKETTTPADQNFMSECRCMQGTYAMDPSYGLNPVVWELSQSPRDRCADLYRIGIKYTPVQSVLYNSETGDYSIIAQVG